LFVPTGDFLPGTEAVAGRRWRAEPAPVGAERQLLTTALPTSHAGMHLLGDSRTWVLITPGSPAAPASMLPASAGAPEGESQRACQVSGVSGGKPGDSQNKTAEQDIRAAPLVCYSSSSTRELTDEPHRNARTSQNLCPTAHQQTGPFLASETGTPKPRMPHPSSLLRQRSHVGDAYGKTHKSI